MNKMSIQFWLDRSLILFSENMTGRPVSIKEDKNCIEKQARRVDAMRRKKRRKKISNGLSIWLILMLFLVNVPFSTIYAETMEATSAIADTQEPAQSVSSSQEFQAEELQEIADSSEPVESERQEENESTTETAPLDENEEDDADSLPQAQFDLSEEAYQVYDSSNGLLSSHATLKAAVDACNAEGAGSYTILVTGDDSAQGEAATIEAGIQITLTSASSTPVVINQQIAAKQRHVIVNGGSLTLKNIILSGEGKLFDDSDWGGTNGGIEVKKAGSLTVDEGAEITETFGNRGGAIEAADSSKVYLKNSGKVHLNQSSDTGGGIYAADSTVELSGTSSISQNIGQWRTGGINLSNSSLVIKDEAAIAGNTAKHNEAGGIKVENNSSVTMNGGSITANSVDDGGNGGGIYITGGSLNLTNGKLQENTASEAGGGIYALNAVITAANSAINQNTGKDGAGIYSKDGSLELSGSTVQENSATLDGGGIYTIDNAIIVTNSKISKNTSATSGGGIFMRGKTLEMTGGEISSNIASNDGGGIRATSGAEITISGKTSLIHGNDAAYGGGISANENSKITVTDGTISENTAKQRGGGVNLDGTETTFTMTGGVVSTNTALQSGGVLADKATVDIKSVAFTENHATGNQAGSGYGGGILVENSGKATIADSTFTDNTAYDGGGIFVSENSQDLKITNSAFTGNRVRHHGGGIVANRTTTEINKVTIENNHADRYGGGIKISDETELTVIDSEIKLNTARYGGGLSVNSGSKVAMTDTNVVGNTALHISDETAEGGTEEDNKGGDGGGINIDLPNTVFTMTGGEIAGNTGESSGGGLFATAQAKFTLTNVSVRDNTAVLAHGGGIFLKVSAEGEIIDSAVEENKAAINGGGIRLEDHGKLTITQSSVSKNTAPYGGGVSANSGSTIRMTGAASKIAENKTTHFGGGVNVDNTDTTFTMENGSIENNPARNGGGVFASDHAQFIMTGGAITKNTAVNNGAGLYLQASAKLHVSNGTISLNVADRSGGGIFTEDYYYASPVDAAAHYKNITIISPGVVSEDNRSQAKQPLPEVNGTLNFDKDYLNDYQVNYFPDSVKIVYDPNGGVGNLYEERYHDGAEPVVIPILSEEDLNYQPPLDNPEYVFLYWCESSDGQGKRYSTGGTDTITMDGDKYLYAIWGPPTTLSGTVFLDKNKNNFYDLTEELENREVTLYKKDEVMQEYVAIETTFTNQDGKYYFAVGDKVSYKISVKKVDGEYGKYGFTKKGTTELNSHVNQDGFSDPLTIDIQNEMKPILNAGYIESVVVTGIKLDTANWWVYLVLIVLGGLVVNRFYLLRKIG